MPDASEFLSELKQKAGFPADFWAPDVELFHYTVEKFADA
jgi:AMMECR1 domain-containing protein